MTFSSRVLFIVGLVLAALVCHSSFKVAAVPVVMYAYANSSNPIDPREGGGFALPSKDDFYAVPKDIAAHANGQLLRSRDVPTSLFGSAAAKVEQIAYKYTMTLEKPDMAVATLITPAGAATTGPFKLVVLSLPEDAAARDCAPSFAISNPGESKSAAYLLPRLTVLALLSHGWHVVVPDLEGSHAAFMAGHTEGAVLLDSIRATLQHEKVDPAQAFAALNGFSGGAHGTGWAINLLPSYAPDLLGVIKAWTAGGIPTNIGENIQRRQGNGLSGLAFEALTGWSNAHPALRGYLDSRMTSEGKAILSSLRDGSLCRDAALGKYANRHFQHYMMGNEDLFKSKIMKIVMAAENLPASAIRPRTLLVHSQQDGVVPIQQVRDLVRDSCSQGANNIELVELKSGDHGQTGVVSLPSWIQVIKEEFGEVATPQQRDVASMNITHRDSTGSGCRTTSDLPVAVVGPQAQALLGAAAYGMFMQQI